ncbi:transglycosylase family protein [Mycolicibacterium sp. SCSIO 43805]|uniref:transglycosylase family protein n=1 Tax=Mycolicibacterium sp. SCSIO 43805 TaxID=3378074 RepID=UPI003AB8A576
MPITLKVEAQADNRSFKQAADRAESYFANAGKAASGSFSKAFGDGSREVEQAASRATKAYDSVANAADKAKTAEQQRQQYLKKAETLTKQAADAEKRLKQARDSDDTKAVSAAEKDLERIRDRQASTSTQVVRSAEMVNRARREESRNIRDAVQEYRALEQAQRRADNAPSGNLMGRMTGSARTAGSEAATEFLDGFGGPVAAIGTKAGPIGIALAAAGVMAFGAGKLIGDQVLAGMQMEKGRDLVQAQLGLDNTSMKTLASGATGAFVQNFGASVQENMTAAGTAIQSGLLDPNATEKQFADMVSQLDTVATVIGSDIPEVARSAGQLIKTGFAADASDAFDMIIAGQQRGLNVSGDWLDTINEYSTQFRKLGLSGADSIGLLSQMVQGGARDTDVAADALKEFSIRVVDNSETTRAAFESVGLNADAMLQKFLTGGPVAREAMQQVVDAINANGDAAVQNKAKLDLFGTQYEDLGAAMSAIDLNAAAAAAGQVTGATGRAMETLGSNAATSWESMMRNIDVASAGMQSSLAEAFGPGLQQFTGWVADHQDDITGFFQTAANAGAEFGSAALGVASGAVRSFGMIISGAGDMAGWVVDSFKTLVGAAATAAGAVGMDGLASDLRSAQDQLGSVSGTLHSAGEGILGFSDDIFSASVNLHNFDAKLGGTQTSAQNASAQINGVRTAMESLPGGRQIDINAIVTFKDQQGRAVDPSQLLGFDPTEFATAGDAQRARRGLPYNAAPGMVPPAGTATPTFVGPATSSGSSSTSLPDAPVLPIQYTDITGMSPEMQSAQNRADEARHNVAEKEARVNQLLQSNVATADEIQKARNDLAKAQQDNDEAQKRLQEAQLKTYQKGTKELNGMASSFSEIGAQLDKDLGISNGLAGLADNFVRFIATLAAAPLLGPLSAISQAKGDEGSGLMGILASNGAFGSQFLPNRGGYSDVGSAYGSVPISGGTPYAGVPLGSSMEVTGQPGLDLLRSLGLKGTTYSSHTTDGASTDREVDVTDPVGGYGSAKLSQFAQFARQNPHLFEEFIYSDPTTGQKTGIRSGQLVGPGTSQPGYYADNWAGHQDHVHMEPAKGGGLGFGGSGVVPVNVVNGGSIAAPLTSAMGQWSADWNAIAQAESGGNWSINTGNGYSGGLQFSPSSWAAAGGTQYAPSAYQASPYQQALTAENLLAMQGPGAWPNTFVPGSSGPLPPLGSVPSSGGALGMGMGMPQSFNPGLNTQAYPAQGGEGGIGMGGMAMDGLMAATSGLDMMAPGAGAAAKIGIQLANRTAKYLGQVAGIGVSGLLETFTPAGSNPKASIGNSWFGKIMGGLAGASPALPNMAGGKAPEMPGGDAKNGAQAAGNQISQSVTINNNHATEDMAGNQAARELGAMYAPAGRQ